MKPKSLIAEAKEINYRKGFSDGSFTMKNAMRREARLAQQENAAFLEEQARKVDAVARICRMARGFGDEYHLLAGVAAALRSRADTDKTEAGK